jgi:non-specific serine/threonine protein kinase
MTGALADYWYLRGQIVQGANLLKRALAIPGDNTPARAKALVGLALMAMLQGDLRRAEKTAQEARDLADQAGDDFNRACALEYLGSIVQRQRRYAEALDLHQQALSIFNSARAMAWSMTSLCNLAWSALGLGNLDAATAYLDQLLNHVGKTGDPHYERVGHLIAGDLACAQRDYQAAYAHYEHAFATSQGDRWLAADAIIGFAGIFTETGHLQRAARLFGAAEALYAEFGVPFPPRNRPAFANWVGAIRTELGDAQSSEEWNTGRAMTDEDVMALLQELASLLQETSIVVSGNGEAPVLCPSSLAPA